MADKVRERVRIELQKIAHEGVAAEQIAKRREYLNKSYGNTKESNRGWMQLIESYYNRGFNYERDYIDYVNDITSKDIRSMARKIVDSGSDISVIMHPKVQQE